MVKKIPLRKCVVTQERLPKKDLLRVVKNNEGEIKCGESPFWKGTIIYIKMPLKNKEPFTRVMYEKEKNLELNYKGIELKFI